MQIKSLNKGLFLLYFIKLTVDFICLILSSIDTELYKHFVSHITLSNDILYIRFRVHSTSTISTNENICTVKPNED